MDPTTPPSLKVMHMFVNKFRRRRLVLDSQQPPSPKVMHIFVYEHHSEGDGYVLNHQQPSLQNVINIFVHEHISGDGDG